MRATFTIAWKDFRSLVFSPFFFFLSALCSVFFSYVFLRAVMGFAEYAERAGAQMYQAQQNPPNIHFMVFDGHIRLINFIFLFAVPAITMRLISEEKKLRTYDLLLTAPVKAMDIAMGKFLAGLGAASALILISLIYPLGAVLFANVSLKMLATAYLGLFLVTGAYVAIGLFASALTESVVLSVVMGVIFNLLVWFLSAGVGTSDNEILVAVMRHVSMVENFNGFIQGSVALNSICFFLSLVGLFVFLSERVIESARWR